VEFHADFPSFLTECLVRAVDLRLRRLSDSQLNEEMDSSDADGLTLVRPLIAQLMKFEKDKPAMSLYFPDLIRGINLTAEARREAALKFAASEEQTPAADTNSNAPAADPDLVAGEQQIAMGHPEAAAAAFERVLARQPDCARALYDLAVASLLQSRADRAEQLFLQVVEAGMKAPPGPAHPDAETLSWSHVYLGRLYDVAGNRDQAVAEYQDALAVAGAPDSARAAAQRGITQSYQTPKRDAGPGN
jgi:tetratricopeptide (TPR) repeat protein